MIRSAFYYGHSIDSNNKYLDFEDDILRVAVLRIGDYSMQDFVTEIARAMTASSEYQEYTATVDRTTRRITISADNNFMLYPQSGDNSGQSPFELIGFELDKIGQNSYTSDVQSGFEYLPQFPLQSFVDFDKIIRPSQSAISESASGIVEVVKFGSTQFMEANLTYITDLEKSKASPIENNDNGVDDALKFLNYIILKKRIEFMKDRENRNEFTRCILESTSESRDGTAFRLQELYTKGLAHHFETGKLEFRKV